MAHKEGSTYQGSREESRHGDGGGEDPRHVAQDHAADDLKWKTQIENMYHSETWKYVAFYTQKKIINAQSRKLSGKKS